MVDRAAEARNGSVDGELTDKRLAVRTVRGRKRAVLPAANPESPAIEDEDHAVGIS